MFVLLAETVHHVHDYSGYGVGWFTLALINAGLAQAKNRSGLAWWVGSLFIGPIATLLIVILDRLPMGNRYAGESASSGH
jgi:hypothetical protein